MRRKFKRAGAGGFWQTINEQPDASVIRQTTPLSCVSATGAMLLQNRGLVVTEVEILARVGEAATVSGLARVMNEIDLPKDGRQWHGLFVEVSSFAAITASSEVWGAVLREGNPLGHLVMVAGLDEQGRVKIKDPWDATSYKMELPEFLWVWGGELIFRWKF